MLELDSRLKLDKKTIESPNLCDRFAKEDLTKLGDEVVRGYDADKQTRAVWERRNEAGIKLAMQVQEVKTFPWAGASNVKFPLITIAAMQFHSRAYPAICNGPEIVKCRTPGYDPDGSRTEKAYRISCHMSWQITEQDEDWESEMDRALIHVPIVGTAFKKSYYSARKGHNVSELVLAQDLVFNYWAKSVEECPRKTHVIPMFRNELHEKIKEKVYRDVSDEDWFKQPPPLEIDAQQSGHDQRLGLTPPQPDRTTPYQMYEQHLDIDLDDDGYDEPYIITVEKTSRCVVRIVCRFDREVDIDKDAKGAIIRVHATEYFTKVPFIPSPDGGVLDIGFGVLLGPINESVDTGINQVLDAGTMGNTAGGFLGRGAKMRGGNFSFDPFEWKTVDSTGDDLRKSIFPLPVREPSSVIFQLLSLLINYANRVSGTTDAIVGESPGQNTPAETQRSMIAQGQAIYSAIFQRIWKSLKSEFKKLYRLNAVYLPDAKLYFAGGEISRQDYLDHPSDVVPSADPKIVSREAKIKLAMTVAERSMNVPGYDKDAVEKYLLRAMEVDGYAALFPGANGQPPPEDPKIAIQKMKSADADKKMQAQIQMFMAKLEGEVKKDEAEILKLQAEAQKLMSEAQTEAQGTMMEGEAAMMEGQIQVMLAQQNDRREQMQMLQELNESVSQRSHERDMQEEELAHDRGIESLKAQTAKEIANIAAKAAAKRPAAK